MGSVHTDSVQKLDELIASCKRFFSWTMFEMGLAIPRYSTLDRFALSSHSWWRRMLHFWLTKLLPERAS